MKYRNILKIQLFILPCLLFSCSSNDNKSSEEYSLFSSSDRAYIEEPNKSLFLSDVVDNDGSTYYFYDLGQIKEVPFYSSSSFYYDKYDYDVTLSFDKLTEKSMSKTFSKAVTRVNTITTSHSISAGATFGAEYGGIPIVGSITGKLTASFNFSIDESYSESFSKSITNTASKTEQYLEQYSTGLSVTIPFKEDNGFERGYRYRMSFFEDYKVYGIIVYDTVNEQYSYDIIPMLSKEDKSMVIEKSNEEGIFEYSTEKKLSFDVDAAIEKAKAYEKSKTKKVNLSRYSGTYQDPYVIENKTTLCAFLSDNEYNSRGKYAIVTRDFDFSSSSDVVIDSTLPPLRANLNFDNHYIRNAHIRGQYGIDGNYYKGIFAFIDKDARLSNLKVSDAYIMDDSSRKEYELNAIGIICGANKGNIVNCSIESNNETNTISARYESNYSTSLYYGAVCGINYGNIDNVSINKVLITSTVNVSTDDSGKNTRIHRYSCGGAVGHHDKGEISNCSLSSAYLYVYFISYDTTLNSETQKAVQAGKLVGSINKGLSYLTNNEGTVALDNDMVYLSVFEKNHGWQPINVSINLLGLEGDI